MKTFLKLLIIYLVVISGIKSGFSQSCVITRVPSSASLPIGGGTTYTFSIITYGGCTPIFTTNYSWLSYTSQIVDNTHVNLKITATANGGPPRVGYVYVDNKESLKITINQAGSYVYVTGVTVSPTTAFINVNELKTLVATVTPANATNPGLVWTTSNSAVATVNSSGLVTGKGSGTATITATSVENSNIKATSTITVSSMAKSFNWGSYISPVKDQLTQGPCFLFASVAVVESKYSIQNNITNNSDKLNLAEAQLNIACLGPEKIVTSFTYIKNSGIVDETCYPYSRSIYCSGPTPYPDCNSPCGTNFDVKAKISNFTNITFAGISANSRADYFKNIIQQNGTVAVSFGGSSLHNGAMHAYEIYGWNEANWLYKDSWPSGSGCFSTNVDIPGIIANNQGLENYVACYVGNVTLTYGSKQGEQIQSDSEGNQKLNREIAIGDHGLGNISLYPNPAKDQIILLDFPPEGGFVQIYKMDGTSVFKSQITGNRIAISNLSQGIYFVKLTINQESKILKLIKQ